MKKYFYEKETLLKNCNNIEELGLLHKPTKKKETERPELHMCILHPHYIINPNLRSPFFSPVMHIRYSLRSTKRFPFAKFHYQAITIKLNTL